MKLKQKKKTKERRLKPNDKKFVEELVKNGGNATKAVKKVYGVKSENYAAVKGNRLIRKDKIIEEIERVADHIPNKLLVETHLDLLKAKEVQRFIFPTRLKDDEIMDIVADAGFTVITIRPSPLGKMAFYSIANSRARKDGLDMAYKLKGSYEAEEMNLRFKGFSNEQLEEFLVSKLSKKK